jgi:hypothetical protein
MSSGIKQVSAAAATNGISTHAHLVGGLYRSIPITLPIARRRPATILTSILAGRRINIPSMARRPESAALLKSVSCAAVVTVLGLTFNENVVDLRNSQVIDIIRDSVLGVDAGPRSPQIRCGAEGIRRRPA